MFVPILFVLFYDVKFYSVTHNMKSQEWLEKMSIKSNLIPEIYCLLLLFKNETN